jgi:Helicase HerA, central domain
MANPAFYLGRAFDPQKNKTTAQAVSYDPADLTTHAVVTGMTGSGKTGLCIDLLEEAALQGIPAIIIDPKGDLTNLLLHFPNLAPQDFQAWIDPEIARRAGETLEQASNAAALAWRKGMQDWGIDHERLVALKNAAEFAIYTPGSDAGIPVSVLSSLNAPELDWDANREVLREKVSSTVTALLGLIGVDDIDPIQSREHILLSNLFENTWSQGKNIELTELILETQNPPFEKLGAFSVDTFFPPKERMALAMKLNNILAAPAFEAWREGQNLDVAALLTARDGRPRHSIFYVAHLSDAERMFFVTLLLSAVETWMRTQPGTGSLRAVLYMDEMFGYLPPTANPPSKEPLLRMLKQARAFGLGLLLATQNPVDVDYKALSNAGTWFIGKLQTDQDKQRLLDGLMSASSDTSRAALDQLISRLGKRVFVLHNVHARQPVLFQTRWTMNFLAGPLTRTQIPALNQLVGARLVETTSAANITAPASVESSPEALQQSPLPAAPTRPQVVVSSPKIENQTAVKAPSIQVTVPISDNGNQTKPALPAGIAEYFLPQTNSLPEAFSAAKQSMPEAAMIQSVVYRPALLASAQVRFLDRKLGVDSNMPRAVLVEKPAQSGSIRWDDFSYENSQLEKLESAPTPGARFGGVVEPLSDSRRMTAMQKDFVDWIYRSSTVKARANQTLKVFAGPDVTQADFIKACAEAAREARDAELEKSTGLMDRKIKTLEEKIAREERELQQDQTELSQRKNEEFGNLAELGASLVGIGRKKSLTTQLTKRRLTEQAKGNVEDSLQSLEQYKKDLAELQQQRSQTAQEITDRWGQAVNEVSEVNVTPKKTDIYVNLFGVAWVPHYVVQAGDQTTELPAFGE